MLLNYIVLYESTVTNLNSVFVQKQFKSRALDIGLFVHLIMKQYNYFKLIFLNLTYLSFFFFLDSYFLKVVILIMIMFLLTMTIIWIFNVITWITSVKYISDVNSKTWCNCTFCLFQSFGFLSCNLTNHDNLKLIAIFVITYYCIFNDNCISILRPNSKWIAYWSNIFFLNKGI